MAKPKDPGDLTEEEFDDRQAMTHASGTQQGMKRCVKYLMDEASRKFREGQDEDAKMLRAYARELEVQAESVYTAPGLDGTPWRGEGKAQ